MIKLEFICIIVKIDQGLLARKKIYGIASFKEYKDS